MPSSSKLDSARRVALCLRDQEATILRAWEDRLLADPAIPSADSLTPRQLTDHVPELLGQIIDALEEYADSHDEAEERGDAAGRTSTAKRHAALRLRQGFPILEVMRELHHLREAVVDICEREVVHLGGDSARLIHAALDAAMITAVSAHEKAARAPAKSEHPPRG